MQGAEAGARAARAAEAAGALRLEVSRLAEQVASVERRNQVLEEMLPAEVLGGCFDHDKLAGKGSGLSESMKLFLRKRFGVGTDFGSSGSELGGRPSSTSAVKAVGKGASDVLASEEGGVKEVLHASEGTRRFRFENRSSSGPGKEGSPENSGLFSERVRGEDHLQLRSSRAGPILSRGVAPVENHSGSALKRSQNGEKHSDTRSSERPSRSSPAARVFFSTRTSSTSQLLIERNAGNREEGIEARRLLSESATASNDADNSDATILHPRDAQEDAKRKESPKRRRLHGAILNAGERNSLTLSPSVL